MRNLGRPNNRVLGYIDAEMPKYVNKEGGQGCLHGAMTSESTARINSEDSDDSCASGPNSQISQNVKGYEAATLPTSYLTRVQKRHGEASSHERRNDKKNTRT
ncbi:hypothetical protein Tco_1432635 [Tanacetum coccineum]